MGEPTRPPSAAMLRAGRDYPVDLAQVRSWFATDEACRDYLAWLRWPDGFTCPACGSQRHVMVGSRYRCLDCRRRVSVTSGTILDRTRTPLTVWFEAAWLMAASKSGVSAAHLYRTLPISSYQTAYPQALAGYTHVPVNVRASGRPAHEALPAVHRLFALVKRMIEGTYQGAGSPEHVQEYLDEFVFRFNRRHSRSRGLVFMRLMQRAIGSGPVPYGHLVRVPAFKTVHPTGPTGPRSQPGTLTPTHMAQYPWRATMGT